MTRKMTAVDYRVPSIGGRMPSPVTSYHKTGDEVEVYCRIRHVNGIIDSSPEQSENEDYDSDRIAACKTLDQKTVALNTIDKRNNKIETVTHYTFTQAFSSQIGQKAVFNNVAKPNIDRLIDGGNALLFAYGVTGSGKTYTMMGSKEEPGILPRTLNMLFDSVDNRQTTSFEVKPGNFNKFNLQSPADAMMERQQSQINFLQNGNKTLTKIDEQLVDYNFSSSKIISNKINPHVKYAVFVTFIEIYNDRIYDLLDDTQRYGISTQHSKKLREDEQKQSYVDGVKEVEVKSMDEAFQQYYRGKERRRLAQTELNFTSSRSHSIFQIRLVRAPFDTSTGELYQDKRLLQVSRLALVDLAGSERVSRTGAQGTVLSEASNINTSLMALRRCIEALRKNQKSHKAEYVPFRTKKLSICLGLFFEGEGKITILICINPSKSDANETEHVLAFAESARKVEVETREIGQLDTETIARKKQELEARDIARMEKAQKYKKDLQKNIRYKIPPAGAMPHMHDETDRERDKRERRATLKREPTGDSDYEDGTSVESGFCAGSTYTVKTSEFDLPQNLGPPPPDIDEVAMDDNEIFPSVINWLMGRKKKLKDIRDTVNRTMPVHVKNLQDLVHQYENHTSHFRELNERYEETRKDLDTEKNTNKRLEAKMSVCHRQLGKLEREKQEQEISLTEKEEKIRELKQQVHSSKGDLDRKMGQAQKRFQQNTDRAVREATQEKANMLRKKEAKLAQLAQVLGKSNFDEAGPRSRLPGGRSPGAGYGGSRPSTAPKPGSPNKNRPNTRSNTINTNKITPSFGDSKGTTYATSRPTTRSTAVNSNPLERHNNLIHAQKSNPPAHSNPLRRRSKSFDNLHQPYLSHKPAEVIKTGTLLQPNCKVSKHVHVPTNKDLAKHSKYLLTAQTLDSEGEVQTQFLKGDIVKTRKMHEKGAHGIAVQFTDVEILKTRDPVKTAGAGNGTGGAASSGLSPSKKRPSDHAGLDTHSNANSAWTDVQTRCMTGIEHKKGDLGPTVQNVKRAK